MDVRQLPEQAYCPRCGMLMVGAVALACTGRDSVRIPLPPYCPDRVCKRRRDEEAIADAIARGVIDP